MHSLFHLLSRDDLLKSLTSCSHSSAQHPCLKKDRTIKRDRVCVRVRESPGRDETATDSDSPALCKCFMADGAAATRNKKEGWEIRESEH